MSHLNLKKVLKRFISIVDISYCFFIISDQEALRRIVFILHYYVIKQFIATVFLFYTIT